MGKLNRYIILVVLFASLVINLQAQYLTGISTKWNDEFSEWILLADVEEDDGELTLRWQNPRDWTKWDFRVLDEAGTIERTWRDDPSQWEIKGYDDQITARVRWAGDFREWRLTNNSQTLILKTRWSNQLVEWQVNSQDYGNFVIYMDYEDDPRDWIIIDELSEDISLAMKIALTFIAVFHSSPKV